jgi:hypothetical protein
MIPSLALRTAVRSQLIRPLRVVFPVSHVIRPIPNSRIVPPTDSMAPSPSLCNIEVKTTDDP